MDGKYKYKFKILILMLLFVMIYFLIIGCKRFKVSIVK